MYSCPQALVLGLNSGPLTHFSHWPIDTLEPNHRYHKHHIFHSLILVNFDPFRKGTSLAIESCQLINNKYILLNELRGKTPCRKEDRKMTTGKRKQQEITILLGTEK